jgi:hypothetical protein
VGRNPPHISTFVSNENGAMFALGGRVIEDGKPCKFRYLSYRRKDGEWKILDFNNTAHYCPIRDDFVIFQDESLVLLKGTESDPKWSSEYSGKWFFYHIPTMKLSVFNIGKDAKVIEAFRNEILIKKGDELYITPIRNHKVKNYKSIEEWKADSTFLAKDSAIERMWELFLFPRQ